MRTDLNKWEISLVYMLILMISAGLSYRFLISPGWKRMSAARFHLNSQRELLQAKTEKVQRLGTMNDEVQGLKMAMAETRERMFSKDETTDFLELLHQVINQTGGVLITMLPHDTMNPLPKQTTEQMQELQDIDTESVCAQMSIQITIRGEYSEIISFFEQLTACRQLINVSKLNITTAPRKPAEVDARFTLNLYVYENSEI